jgi:hypothetical protein
LHAAERLLAASGAAIELCTNPMMDGERSDASPVEASR